MGLSSASALTARFATEGPRASQVSDPRGVAVNQTSGDVYVADHGNRRIDAFGPEGEFLRAWGWGVADGETEALQTCTTTCFAGIAGSGAGQFLGAEGGAEGIAVDNDPLSLSYGDVYVLDPGNARVQKFGPEGEFLLMFGGEVNASSKEDVCLAAEAARCKAGVEGSGPGEFERLVGRSIAVDTAGTVYVADRNRVQRFTGEGLVQGAGVALPGVGAIPGLAVDSIGDLYVHGGEQEGVHKYNPTGGELGSPRDTTGAGELLAIAVGLGDELFLNDFREGVHHILTFSAAGEQTASFDAGDLAADAGRSGIAYSEHTQALYVLNSGAVRIVTPPPPGPFVLLGSQSASEIQPTNAKLGAIVNPEGSSPTHYFFEYGTSEAYGQSTPETPLTGGAFEDQPASATITGLRPGTTYHYRTVAENTAGEVARGPDAAFTTLPPVSIDGTSVVEVNATSARLQADLNPHGLPSEYHFEYDTSPYVEGEPPHGTTIPIPDGNAGSATNDTTVSDLIGELTPSTTYHYRVIAHNRLGNVEGSDHSFATQGPASTLPDGRTWEQVSPPNKHGAPLEPLTEVSGVIQTAAAGGTFAYVAKGPITGEPKGVRSPEDAQLLATRGPAGWSTQDISTPHEEIAEVQAGVSSEYKFFAEDLSASVVEPHGATPLSPHTTERTPYRREANGEFVALVTAANVPPETKFGGTESPPGSGQWAEGVEFLTATPDLRYVMLSSPQALTPGFPAGFEPNGSPYLYELSSGRLTLVSILPNEQLTPAGLGGATENRRGAISSDGKRVVFGAGSNDLFVRDVGLGQTVQVDERQPGAAGGGGEAVFQAASTDGSRVFFTDTAELTADATAGPGEPDLYMCEVEVVAGRLSCGLSDLSVDPNPGEPARVQGFVSAIDTSGEHVYFAADGVLTSAPNALGEHAVPGECQSEGEAACNLYVYDTSLRRVSLVAVLSSRDDPDWAGRTHLFGLGNLTARSSPNGRFLVFMSQRSLTGYDNRDARSGQRDAEVFLFNAASETLRCVSCDPSGARPLGVFDPPREVSPGLLVDRPRSWRERWLAGSIPGWTLGPSERDALYQSRYLSDSGRLFFDSADALVPQDTNKVEDVYEFEPPGVGGCTTASRDFSAASGGCVGLISSGTSKEESAFLDASESGDEAFFLTAARLVGSDVDSALDVYDAHVCSTSSPCPLPAGTPAPACEGDACQTPTAPPVDQSPGSLTYRGPGNAPAPVKATVRRLTRGQLLAHALRACRKKRPVSKRRACVREAHKRYAAKPKRARKAGRTRRGGRL